MTRPNFRPLIAAGVTLGIGMGGFVDGILLHQILQVHNMLSNRRFPDTLVNVEINMFWDGLFHAFTWMATLAGIAMLWVSTARGDVPHSSRALVGSLVMGWGIFNVVEGVIDHEVLQIHHVIQRAPYPAQLYWDLGFLLFGGVSLIYLGWVQLRKAIRIRRNAI
ncbi:MAG: DUF2243 domain-containing protein [Bdellovibrionia bacterium]